MKDVGYKGTPSGRTPRASGERGRWLERDDDGHMKYEETLALLGNPRTHVPTCPLHPPYTSRHLTKPFPTYPPTPSTHSNEITTFQAYFAESQARKAAAGPSEKQLMEEYQNANAEMNKRRQARLKVCVCVLCVCVCVCVCV